MILQEFDPLNYKDSNIILNTVYRVNIAHIK